MEEQSMNEGYKPAICVSEHDCCISCDMCVYVRMWPVPNPQIVEDSADFFQIGQPERIIFNTNIKGPLLLSELLTRL